MTPQETLLLTRYVKACCPQQAMDDFTPDAWHDLLGDLTPAAPPWSPWRSRSRSSPRSRSAPR